MGRRIYRSASGERLTRVLRANVTKSTALGIKSIAAQQHINPSELMRRVLSAHVAKQGKAVVSGGVSI